MHMPLDCESKSEAHGGDKLMTLLKRKGKGDGLCLYLNTFQTPTTKNYLEPLNHPTNAPSSIYPSLSLPHSSAMTVVILTPCLAGNR
ncbi:hypothetical protein [Absidia glauca]|uniref:Uncharacterized protein n=1 Tax=Absidia glauca TaxID=4829 RepID=A0A168R7X9_ABSGL|nr:hypothetical protein [Absidia glauca]